MIKALRQEEKEHSQPAEAQAPAEPEVVPDGMQLITCCSCGGKNIVSRPDKLFYTCIGCTNYTHIECHQKSNGRYCCFCVSPK